MWITLKVGRNCEGMKVGGGCILRCRSYSASSPEGSDHTSACFCIRPPHAFSCRQVILHVCVRVLSCLSRIQLCNPEDRGQSGSSVHGILQARILDWVAMLSSRGSSPPRGVYFIHMHKRKCYLKKNCQCMAKTTTICKVISLQLIKINEK